MSGYTLKTAKTKVHGDAHVFAQKIDGADKGEHVLTLVRVDGRRKEVEHLMSEWTETLERTLLTPDEDGYERLEACLKEMNGLLKGLLISEHIHEVHALIAVVEPTGVLHVSAAGRAEAYLIRKGSAVQITEHEHNAADGAPFLHISSGDIERGDTVLFSTVRLLRSMTPVQIAQAARHQGEVLEAVQDTLESEKEIASLAALWPEDGGHEVEVEEPRPRKRKGARSKSVLGNVGSKLKGRKRRPASENAVIGKAKDLWDSVTSNAGPLFERTNDSTRSFLKQFTEDLQHPERKRRAHLLLLAGAIVVFLAIYSGFQVSTSSSRSQTRAELEKLVEKINQDIRTAENRELMGDLDSANAILTRAEEEARTVMSNENGLFRTDALDILDRIRAKREQINNVIRLAPTVSANLSTQHPDISARGLIGIERGRMIAYDRQNLYSIIVNAVDEPLRLDGDNLILDGTYFERYKTSVFMTKENRLIELIEGQPTAMKTDDPAGWITGPDAETYVRFLYILSPQNNQIYKYERLSNRYSEPSEYNVNGNLEGGIDMVIDSDIYILHQGGKVTKLLRGEEQSFAFRGLPEEAIDTVTRMAKPSDRGNFYFLDPENSRVIVTRTEDDLGESLYLKQYVLEGDNVGTLQDLYVGADETHLYVLDEKKVYAINLQEG